MMALSAGLALFFGSHVATGFLPIRRAMTALFGEKAYKGLFTLVSLAGFALIIYGGQRAGFAHLYLPPGFGAWVPALTMPLACILLIGAYSDPGIKAVVRHPFLWAVLIFAASHLFANGEQVTTLVFGSFLVYAPLAMLLADRKAAARDAGAFQAFKARTSHIPFAAWARAPSKPKWRTVIGGVVLYAVIFWTHALVIGASAAAGL
mgnify:CR=1 FL=1